MQRIARVLKSNGKDGEVLLGITDVNPEDIDLQEPVFIYFDGLPVPFYFESLTRRGNQKALARLTGIHSLKDADELSGREVFADYFEEDEADIIGFTLLNESDGTPVGTVADYEEIPGNPCLWVKRPDGSEVMVPYHENLLVAIDTTARTLTLLIPEGLL